eukprot:2715472-Amphidinium_carterae.1
MQNHCEQNATRCHDTATATCIKSHRLHAAGAHVCPKAHVTCVPAVQFMVSAHETLFDATAVYS